jgi:circadian clock protein KaiC
MQRQSPSETPLSFGKMPTRIAEFDEITGGGLPRGRTTLIVGGPGSGKTVFALQTVVNNIQSRDEPAIFVAFEENTRQIVANAASFGWDLPALQEDKLFFLDARMSVETVTAGRFDLAGLLAGLEAKAAEMGARRIVFDSLDVLLTVLDNPALERQETYRLRDWLAQSDLTGIITVRGEERELRTSARHGFMQFMADCVIHLTQDLEDRVSLRTLRVAKYRGSSFAENEFPFIIGTSGVEIGSTGVPQPVYEAQTQRVSTGVERLDTMLSGGVYRGSSLLITGAPGTAKSTLCAAFIGAACRRGERCLYVSFDEAAGELMRNFGSVNIQLRPHVESGLLRIHSAWSHGCSAQEHLTRLKRLIAEHQPACMAVDPVSAMAKAGGMLVARSMTDRLLGLTRAAGITMYCTSLVGGEAPQAEATDLQISTIADTWIHLSYVINAGERNRALSIVKSRGTGHSRQVRELVLGDEGITLADVYASGGEVLMGTLRWERENAAGAEKEKMRAEWERRAQELERIRAEAQARMEAIQREIEAIQAQGLRLEAERRGFETDWRDRRDEVRLLRGADSELATGGSHRPEDEPADQETKAEEDR